MVQSLDQNRLNQKRGSGKVRRLAMPLCFLLVFVSVKVSCRVLLCLCGRWHFPVPTAQVDKTRSFGCQLLSFWSWLVSHRMSGVSSHPLQQCEGWLLQSHPRTAPQCQVLGWGCLRTKSNQEAAGLLLLVLEVFVHGESKGQGNADTHHDRIPTKLFYNKEGKSLKHWKLLNFCICPKKPGLAFKTEFEAALEVSGRDVVWSAHKKRYMNSTQLSSVCIDH